MNTKDRILEISLDLMSQKGFESVSIRDICKKVGIKESTVYYHYKNKNDILESIIGQFIELTNEMIGLFKNASFDDVNDDIFKATTLGFVEQYLLNDSVIKFVKLSVIEQNNNVQMRTIYIKYFFDMPIDFQKHIFSELIEVSVLKDYGYEIMAKHYYSYIFFMYSKYVISQSIDSHIIDAFKTTISEYTDNFLNIYGANING
ncbi:MAG: TetR/AcrR family transcriptional regulator [Eubacteriales bacterium]